jgi:thioredoxin 1
MAVKDVSEANFESEVLNSKIPVVVDLWAEWCVATDSVIFTDRRKSIVADSIKKNDTLLTYDGKNILPSTVIYSETTSKGGHCKKIETENNKTIKVTDDHLLYTPAGWKRADELKNGGKVAIYPLMYEKINNKSDTPKTISRNMIIGKPEIDKVTEDKMHGEHLERLIQLQLLPFRYDNPKIHLVSRLVGLLFSDGSLYRRSKNNICNADLFLGQKEDVEELSSDLKELGFKFSIKRRVNKFKIAGRSITISTYRLRIASTAFWLFMRALGVPNGRKTDSKSGLPDWLLKAPSSIKREFLSGYLGGDGPSISIKVVSRGKRGSYNDININDIEFYKEESCIKSGVKFANQLTKLLEEQDIKVRKVFVDKEKYKRKYGGTSKSIHVSLSNSYESARALASIGYAYCWKKQEGANYIGEFLNTNLYKKNLWGKKYKDAVNLSKIGKNSKEIASKLAISNSTVDGWLKKGNEPTINHTHIRYNEWLSDATRNLSGGLVWETIGSVTDTYLQNVQRITVQEHSNFIANGFLVHNCGPCRMFSPIVDQVAEELEGKVKVVKINVDNNQKLAEKYGVMSIPTTLLIKDGKLKAANVGAVPREALKQWITKNIS